MEFLTGIGLGVAGNFVTKAIEAVAKSWTEDRWQKADEKTRLFSLLEGAYGDELPAFTVEELARTWGSDAAFLEVYDRLSAGAEPRSEREALVRAIEPLVGPTATETPRQLAERVADFLPYLIPHSKQKDERVLYAIRQVANLMETQHEATTAQLSRIETAVGGRSATLILSSDWPEAPEDALRRAIEADQAGVAQLDEALRGKDRAAELSRLVRNPRAWMMDLKAAVWELIAVSCEEYGLLSEAPQAWLTARGLPGADFAGCSVRAAEAAFQTGERDRPRTLMDEARADDPTHPRVVLQDALAEEDPGTALSLLDSIGGADSATAAVVEVAKASAHLARHDIERARQSLANARKAGAQQTGPYRLVQSAVSLAQVFADPRASAQRAGELAGESIELEGDLRSRHQFPQAAEARVQASAAHSLIGDFGTARALLADAVDIYKDQQPEARLAVAMAAASLESYETVRALVRPDDDRARAQYLRAVLKARGDAEPDVVAAATELDGLLDSEHARIRDMAAFERLLLAGQAPGIDWSERAAAVVAERDPSTDVVLKAFWLERTGQVADAERELLRHSDRSWALRQLMTLMGRADEWKKAAGYADALLRHDDVDWVSRLNAAEAFRLSGDEVRAEGEFRRLAENLDAAPEVRTGAYRRLVEGTFSKRDYAAALALTRPWLELNGDDPDAGWAQAISLAMLGKDKEALAAIEQRGLRPRHPDEYRIAAQLYISAGEPVSAVRKVIELADEQNPRGEQMEALVISAALRVGSAMPEDLRGRVSLQRFTELFPDSERLQARSIEDFKTFLVEDLRERAEHIKTVEDQVYDAYDTPTAVLAAVTGHDVGGLWMRIADGRGLPLGHGNSQLELLEREDARAAITGAVIWDATSIFVVDHVLEGQSDIIRTAFPGSSITQATLADIAEAVRQAVPEQPGRERKELAYDLQAGRAEFRDLDPGAVEGDMRRAQRALDFAHKLGAVPNADPAAPQPEDDQLDLGETSAFRGMVATFSAARRLGLPIYSDDREIRRRARASGLRAFGTVAALDALTERGLISIEQRGEARRTLLGARALGVHLSGYELIELARGAGWDLNIELFIATRDPGQWREGVPATLLTWVGFLYGVFREAPERFVAWVLRVLDAIHVTRPELRLALHVRLLFTMSLISFEPDATEFSRALLRALDRARQYFPQRLGDPALVGLADLMRTVSEPKYGEERKLLVVRAWLMLPLADQVRALPLLESWRWTT